MENGNNSGSGSSEKQSNRLPLSDVVSDCLRRWFHDTLKEARAGDLSMQVLVAQMYYNGYGIPKDHQKAKIWMTRAARIRSSVWKVSNKRPVVIIGCTVVKHLRLGRVHAEYSVVGYGPWRLGASRLRRRSTVVNAVNFGQTRITRVKSGVVGQNRSHSVKVNSSSKLKGYNASDSDSEEVLDDS